MEIRSHFLNERFNAPFAFDISFICDKSVTIKKFGIFELLV